MLHTFRRLTLALLAGVSLAACGDVLNPGRPAAEAPAQLALSLNLPRLQTMPIGTYSIDVETSYQLAAGGVVALETVRAPLSDALTTQQVPITVELSRCLADQGRLGATADPNVCTVQIVIRLRRGDTVLDEFLLTGVRLVPGESTTVPSAVELFEVASVFLSIAPGGDSVPPVQTFTVGTTAAYLANARTATGEAITGRTTAWSSSNTAVMTVLSGGVVEAISPGTARITATVGGRSAFMDFVVIPPAQRLTVAGVPGTGVGRVTSVPAGIDCTITRGVATGTCAFDFAFGTNVQLSAVPTSGARFTGWTGACLTTGLGPQCTLAMTESRSAGAGFVGLSTVTIAPNAVGGLTISSLRPSEGVQCTLNSGGATSGVCSATFAIGDTVALEAEEFTLARLQGWQGCDVVEGNSCLLVITETPRIITVDVDAPTVLSATPFGDGSGLVSAPGFADTPDLSCGAPPSLGEERCSGSYPSGSSVVVTATPSSGSRFERWESSGVCDQSTQPTCLVQFSGQPTETLVAVFALEPVPITLNLSGSGGGQVFINSELACELSPTQTSTQCVVLREIGDSILVAADVPGAGQFLGFGGDCAGTFFCGLTVTAPLTISATFTSEPPSATVRVAPSAAQPGRGFVGSDDESLSCTIVGGTTSGTCSIERQVGDTITLFAEDYVVDSSAVDVFRRWSADSPCPNSPEPVCTFVLDIGGADARVTYGPGAQMTIFLGVSAQSSPFLVIEVSSVGYRQLEPCEYRDAPESTVCQFALPRGPTVRIEARTRQGLQLDLSEFSACQWSGSFTSASCTLTLTGNLGGGIYAFQDFESTSFATSAVFESRHHVFHTRRRVGVTSVRTID